MVDMLEDKDMLWARAFSTKYSRGLYSGNTLDFQSKARSSITLPRSN